MATKVNKKRRVGQRGKTLGSTELLLFIDGLRCGMTVEESAAKTGRSRQSYYAKRARDPKFKERMDDAQAAGAVRWDQFWENMALGHVLASAATAAGLDRAYVLSKARADAAFGTRVKLLRWDRHGDDRALIYLHVRAQAEQGKVNGLIEFHRSYDGDMMPPRPGASR